MIGLAAISGEVGSLTHTGQWLATQPLKRWLGKNHLPRLEHAFVALPGGLILEAEPGGAKIRPLHYENVYWCTQLYDLLPADITGEQVMGLARQYQDVG